MSYVFVAGFAVGGEKMCAVAVAAVDVEVDASGGWFGTDDGCRFRSTTICR